jgi:hypothetical protein
VDGVYLDSTVMPFPCSNELHGCGYPRADGVRAGTYPVFAIRGTLKRLYTVIKQRRPEGLVDVHVYDAMTTPALAWATSYWSGEQLSPAPFVLDAVSLDRFRCEMMGRNWGVPAEYLHYRAASYQNAFGLGLLHDVLTRAAGLNADFDLEASVWKAMDSFGREEATWRPYWDNGGYVTVSPADCHASLYQHPRNGVMVIVDNLSRGPAEVRLTLSRDKLGLTGDLTARDALTGAAVATAGDALTTSLPSMGWQLIWLKPAR